MGVACLSSVRKRNTWLLKNFNLFDHERDYGDEE
jgi:hypothetical protein